MLRLVSALSHLKVPFSADHSLAIRIWDSTSSGQPQPEGPWNGPGESEASAIRGLFPGGQGFFQWHDRSLAVLDLASDAGYYWVDDAGRDPWPERAAPLSPMLGAWLAEGGVHVVHAGAVGTARGCVLLVGRAGSGKSHTALACLQEGVGFLGDDTCALDSRDPPTAYSIYSSAQAQPFTLRSLPELRPMVSNPDRRRGEKALLFLNEHEPGSLVREAPLRAIAVVAPSGHGETRVRPASWGDVLVALAPSSLLARPGTGQRMLARLAQVARGVECVHLETGRDPSKVARAVRTLL
jgi:hypothetical protein